MKIWRKLTWFSGKNFCELSTDKGLIEEVLLGLHGAEE